ncbi:MAG: ABC transporter ATP-binding protein [Eubacterium sp.]|nr:ABC transporter ATP-binding protein [Eubacterium sp.]
MIEINHLVKKYGNNVAVDDLSLKVEPGKIYGFLGPNGAGKSTTMNILTGYIGATSGEVIINGHNILSEPEEAKKDIGYLPELPPLYTDMTVYEYLIFCAELKGIPKAERQSSVGRAMWMTKIEDMRNRLIKNLSKGYKQRVGLAQAIINMPKIIILDEPTVGLDPKQIIEIRDLIRELGKDHTVILSSHILSEVSEVCDHVFIISHGKLVASDSPENLSANMEQGATLKVKAKGEEDKIKNIVSKLDGVKSVNFIESENDGEVSFDVELLKDADIREELSMQMALEKMPVLEMTLEQKSLEDVFLELTGSTSELEREAEELSEALSAESDDDVNKENVADVEEENTQEAQTDESNI